MEFVNLLRDYPKIGAAIIALLGIIVGGLINNGFQLFKDRLNSKRELRGFVIKEKINAAKKASEYYLEQLNYYNLLIQQLNFLTSSSSPSPEMIDDFNKQVEYYSDRLKKFPHFEHHHINIFYKVIDKKSVALVTESIKINNEILELQVYRDDPTEVMNKKIEKITIKAKRQKEIYEQHYRILIGYLDEVREDISKYS